MNINDEDKGNSKSEAPNNKKLSNILGYIEYGRAVIFALSYCPFTVKAEQLLSNLNISSKIVYLDMDNPTHKIDKEFKVALESNSGIDTYPIIYLGLVCVGGYIDLYDLFTQNKLFELLRSEGIDYMDEDYY
jgi:glutaredoxin